MTWQRSKCFVLLWAGQARAARLDRQQDLGEHERIGAIDRRIERRAGVDGEPLPAGLIVEADD